MTRNNENGLNATGDSTDTPATVLLQDGTAVAVHDQFVNSDGFLCLYITAKETGIDARVNLDNVKAILTSYEAGRLFGVEDAVVADDLRNETADEDYRVTEEDIDSVGDLPELLDDEGTVNEDELLDEPVEWNGELWQVRDVSASGRRLELEPVTVGAADWCRPTGDGDVTARAPRDQVEFIEFDEDDEDDEDGDERPVEGDRVKYDGGIWTVRQRVGGSELVLDRKYEPVETVDVSEVEPVNDNGGVA